MCKAVPQPQLPQCVVGGFGGEGGGGGGGEGGGRKVMTLDGACSVKMADKPRKMDNSGSHGRSGREEE